MYISAPIGLLWHLGFTTSILFVSSYRVMASEFCPVSYQLIGPVCGTDGVTYPSICSLEVARLQVQTLDVALLRPCENYCNRKWEPLCGSDMVTYANRCTFDNAAKEHPELKVFHLGQCMTQVPEEKQKYINFNYVLDSMPRLYSNFRQRDPHIPSAILLAKLGHL